MNSHTEQLLKDLSERENLFLAFDRDGTLVDYADHPDLAVMSDELKETLRALARLSGIEIAIVSARSIRSLERDFDAGDGVSLAGNYGLEVRLRDGSAIVEAAIAEAIPELETIVRRLAPLADEDTGGILEDHGLSICLHWHRIAESRMAFVREQIQAIREDLDKVRFQDYPTSFEFVPDIDWSKADGLRVLERRLGLGGKNVFSLFFGDTDSDEPGFEWSHSRGGSSVRVGSPKVASIAKYRLERPAQVGELLSRLLELRTSRG
ncbi:MAG: trehalose-phosphatase [Candidatus Melainabacteria bacterium]|nr:trehalose-phosphatase [Candidatus Melainabacteria bacterium]